ncbi:hypothetical protein L1987_02209 [Smallanthus sonchifolius]|uniref:Uncharacterized protein n=1 Tax=Smallanthus sonchifolius TaxID=185202 RepID=A0ACB9K763_9ASTR|nr:hypothetical protein L1987_02209 [Smallanthus sonchifolius]
MASQTPKLLGLTDFQDIQQLQRLTILIVVDQMDSSCFLIPIFTFVCGNFSVFIITSLILGSSAFLFLTHTKHNAQDLEQEDQQHYQEDEFDPVNSDHNDSNRMSNVISKECLNVGSTDSCSESEIIDPFSCTTEEDSDFDGWQFSGEDGSISDEESLIEIELPGGHYVGYKDYKEEEPKFCRRQKSPDSVLWWPEMNEEENMIEIDLTMGSIMCSRFEIKA